jgi:hypothetical protein
MITKMIRPRPSAFSRYFVKSIYLQSLKPQLQIRSPNKNGKFSHMQKRNCSAHSQKEPDTEPPFWLLIASGCIILYNLRYTNIIFITFLIKWF